MALVQGTSVFPASTDATARCAVDHAGTGQRKASRDADAGAPSLARDAAGVWHVRGFEEARAILRSSTTRQAGFRAELIIRDGALPNLPILYQEGKVHQEQRKQTARFFTPKAVSTSYRQLMETLADGLVAELRQRRRADLSDLSLALAVQVTAQVVGLTNSPVAGMARRLGAFFQQGPPGRSRRLARLREVLNLRRLLAFYWWDVRPAARARRQQPHEDVISHLLAQHYNDREILTECVTYGAAGMATTREFISMAAWHLLEQPDLRARYLAAPEEERQALLHEVLRLEPIIGHLHRRATGDISLVSNGVAVVIPEGADIDLHIDAANADPAVAGADPLVLCPGRAILAERVGAMVLSFGDGAHRCPGNYIALQETDIFLMRFLALDGLRIVRPPTLTWNAISAGYELRRFLVALDPT